LESSRRLAKQVLSQLSYTPTAGTGINSKASAAVRETRNTTICPFNLGPAIEFCELKTAGTSGERTEILRGYSIVDFVRHDGELDQLGHAEGSCHGHIGSVAPRGH
jgi:hypothetical protein